MDTAILKRTTFIVADAEAAAGFFRHVFGWRTWYDNVVRADRRFPPSGAAAATDVRLVILQALDEKIGKLGLLEYPDPPFDTGRLERRSKVRMGEPILVIETEDVDAVYARALEAGATVITEPVDWEVPSPDGESGIRLRSVSMFTPDGIYLEVSEHP